MQLETTKEPIKYRLKTGEEITLRPGVPIELPDHAATQLLKKAADKVHLVDSVIEPAAPQARSVYWEKADTSIWGPATPLLVERSSQDYVLVVEYRGELISVNAKVLRSKEAFETQVEPRVVT
jgi:hypothetical protein